MINKIHWLSNAPWSATGYGNQTRVFMSRIRDLGYEMSATAFYGLDGAILHYDNMPIYPKRHDTYGQDIAAANAQHAGAKVIISLLDAWVCNSQSLQKDNVKWIPWFPVDSEPLPGAVAEAVKMAYKRIVFSPFAVRMMEQAELDCYYVPHGVDTEIFKPINKGNKPSKKARERIGFPTDKFIVGMVSANKGNPSRKAFFEQLTAFAGMHAKHPDTLLYLHTYDGIGGYGFPVNLPGLICSLDLEIGKDVIFCNQHTYNFSFPDVYMNDMYNSLDVLMNVSMGEGFGIPIIEAQASGCPVIIGDWTSMEDFCFSGHQVQKADSNLFLTGIEAIQYIPHMMAIQDLLEAEYNKPSSRQAAREGALIYGADYVTEEYWKPTLKDIFEQVNSEYGKSKLVRFGDVDESNPKMNDEKTIEEAYIEYAKAINKTVDELTKEDKKTALVSSILETERPCKHEWHLIGLYTDEGLCVPCKECGAAMIKLNFGAGERIQEGYFKNYHNLEFFEPDGLEWLLMKECEQDYEIGLDITEHADNEPVYIDGIDLDENSVVIDVGAHVGVVSMTLAKKYGCRVYAYEPHPNNFMRLSANLQINNLDRLVFPSHDAVTLDGREVTISHGENENSGAGNIYQGGHKTSSIAFDDILESFEQIDLLKVDCEGAEYEFLAGADLSIVKAIRGEFHGGKEKGQALLDAVIKQVPNTKVTLL